MKAIVIGNEKSLHWQDVEAPMPKAGEVLIKVKATAINRADLMQRQGFYPPPLGASDVMGLECAGEIAGLGEGVKNWAIGDPVCALLAGGGYAEFTCVDQGSVLPVPKGLSMLEAASLPEVYATAWLNLFMEGQLQSNEKVILHAGASGVGTAAIQLCRVFSSPCFVTIGNQDKLDSCIGLGAESGAIRHEGSFFEKAQSFAGDAGVDVILDPVGGSYLADNLNILGLNGRLILIGLMGGAEANINLAFLLMKRIKLIGSTLRARPLVEKADVMAQLLTHVWPKLESGDIKPVIDKVFSIAEIEAAHEHVASNNTLGKVVVEL